MQDGYHIVERDSDEWDEAWGALAVAGQQLADWMLIRAERSGRYAFKHIVTREYLFVGA